MRTSHAHAAIAMGLLLGVLVGSAQASDALPDGLARLPVAEIRAEHANGTLSLGSGVVLGRERLVTNCHVVQGARDVRVIHDGRKWAARLDTVDAHHDLCTVRAAGLTGQSAPAAVNVSVGQRVFAVGFPAGKPLSVSEGRIVALHHYDAGNVLQVSAPFDRGESGGGLFDSEGRLIGILSFKAPAGGIFHFALPVAWLEPGVTHAVAQPFEWRAPFWQLPFAKLPDFLRVLSVQATNAGTHSVH